MIQSLKMAIRKSWEREKQEVSFVWRVITEKSGMKLLLGALMAQWFWTTFLVWLSDGFNIELLLFDKDVHGIYSILTLFLYLLGYFASVCLAAFPTIFSVLYFGRAHPIHTYLLMLLGPQVVFLSLFLERVSAQ